MVEEVEKLVEELSRKFISEVLRVRRENAEKFISMFKDAVNKLFEDVFTKCVLHGVEELKQPPHIAFRDCVEKYLSVLKNLVEEFTKQLSGT